jgi:hypothetical protein
MMKQAQQRLRLNAERLTFNAQRGTLYAADYKIKPSLYREGFLFAIWITADKGKK